MIHLNFSTVNKKCKEGVVRAMKKCRNCGKILSDDARFCISCGNELKDDNVLLEQIEGNTIEKTQVNTELYKENITKKSDSNKRIYKVIAVILIIAVLFLVGQKIIGVEGTYYREGTLNDNLILRGGVAYSDGMVLCSYEKSGNKIMFYTDDGIYYGTYDWNERKLYVDDEIYVKNSTWNPLKLVQTSESSEENQYYNLESHYGISINDAVSLVDDEANILQPEEVANILNHVEYMSEISGYNIMIVTTYDDCKEGAREYADNYYDTVLENYRDQYSLTDDGYVFVINMNIRECTLSTCGKAIENYTDQKIDEMLDDIGPKVSDGYYEDVIIQFVDHTIY